MHPSVLLLLPFIVPSLSTFLNLKVLARWAEPVGFFYSWGFSV